MRAVRGLTAWELALALSGWAVLILMLLPAGMPVRSIAVAAFLFWCPGAALLKAWPRKDRLERAVLTVAISICVSLIIAEMQAFVGLWDPAATIAVLALATTSAVLAAVHRSHSHVETR